MIRLTSNINDELLRELIDRSPGCPQSCSSCDKPEGVCCVTWAQNANCFKTQSHFNNYVMFSTGVSALGFQFAVTTRTLFNILAEGNNPWNAQSIEELILICTKDNELCENKNALQLFNLAKNCVIYHKCKESTNTLGSGYYWCCYADGSGHLEDVYGKSIVRFDVCQPDEIEYRLSNAYGWKWFYGSFEQFKTFAEETIKEQNLL